MIRNVHRTGFAVPGLLQSQVTRWTSISVGVRLRHMHLKYVHLGYVHLGYVHLGYLTSHPRDILPSLQLFSEAVCERSLTNAGR